MITNFLSKNNLILLLIAGLLFSLISGFYFIEAVLSKHSFLLLNNSGHVFRSIFQPYLYSSNLVAVTFSVIAALLFIFLLLFVLLSMQSDHAFDYLAQANKIDQNLTKENEVFYGKGPISDEVMKLFVRHYPESAVKFIFEQNIDGSKLDPLIKNLHNDWVIRGMNQQAVKDEIQRLLNTEINDSNLYNLTNSIRKVVEQNTDHDSSSVN